jgi:hypothetical protein
MGSYTVLLKMHVFLLITLVLKKMIGARLHPLIVKLQGEYVTQQV